MPPIIEVNNITKTFPSRRGGRALLGKGGLQDWIKGGQAGTFDALKGVSLNVEPGEALGIIGGNGSGKSTLLKIISGVSAPTTGEVNVYGRIASLLELGAGFHPMLTGRENIYLNASLLGVRRREVDKVLDEIIAFSGIAEFIDNPVMTYSSGMYVRLGFAVAVNTNPDVFLVDEVLSVGDEEFQRKCRARIADLRSEGKTLVFVSHDLGIVNAICDRVIMLAKGELVQRATPQATIDYYLCQVGEARGTHILRKDNMEVVASNGRIGIFKDEKPVSAPNGFDMNVKSSQDWHDSSSAVWRVQEGDDNACTMYGELPRLPVVYWWNIRFDDDGVIQWEVSIECKRDVEIFHIDINFTFPTEFTKWIFAGLEGVFPDIEPGQANWQTVVASEAPTKLACALPGPDSPLPPVSVSLESHHEDFRFIWNNTDYGINSRALQANARPSEASRTYAKGTYKLATGTVNMTQDLDTMRKDIIAQQTLEHGKFRAVFRHGNVELYWGEEKLTAFLDLYGSMLINYLWSDSHHLQWSSAEPSNAQLRIRALSRRFPYDQIWEMSMGEDGLDLAVYLDVREPMDVTEYHVSVVLKDAYTRWATDAEAAEFPPFENGVETWKHGNEQYAPGTWIRAEGEGLPTVTLRSTADDLPVRMTSVRTGDSQRGHVLQALRTADQGMLHFEPGEHLYFKGRIEIQENK